MSVLHRSGRRAHLRQTIAQAALFMVTWLSISRAQDRAWPASVLSSLAFGAIMALVLLVMGLSPSRYADPQVQAAADVLDGPSTAESAAAVTEALGLGRRRLAAMEGERALMLLVLVLGALCFAVAAVVASPWYWVTVGVAVGGAWWREGRRRRLRRWLLDLQHLQDQRTGV